MEDYKPAKRHKYQFKNEIRSHYVQNAISYHFGEMFETPEKKHRIVSLFISFHRILSGPFLHWFS